MPPYWRTLGGPFLVANSENIVDCVEVLGCKSAISDCAANDFGNGIKEEPPCGSKEKDGSKCRIRGRVRRSNIKVTTTYGLGLLSAPL